MLTEIGPVEIEVPRDTDASFSPSIVRKRQRRLPGVDEIVLSLSAKGLTTGEIAAHFDDVYGAQVSKDTISRITEKVVAEMTEWRNRDILGLWAGDPNAASPTVTASLQHWVWCWMSSPTIPGERDAGLSDFPGASQIWAAHAIRLIAGRT